MSQLVISHNSKLSGEWEQPELLEGEVLSPEEALALERRSAPAWPELLEAFLQAQDISKASKNTYRRQLRQFGDWLEETGRSLFELQREDILAYKNRLREDGKSAYTVSGYMVAIRRLFTWLEGERIYPNIAKSVKGAKSSRGHKKDTLTKGQLRELLDSIDRSSLEGLRDYALINLLARTGLRTIEARRASIGDIRQIAGQTVLYVQGKGREEKDEFVLLSQKAEKPLRDYLKARGFGLPEEAPLFASTSNRNNGKALTTRSLSRIVKEKLKAIGLNDKRLSAHSLRHSAITMAIQGGAELEQAQAMARHSSPATTMIYFHNLNRIKAGAELAIDF